MWEEEEETKGRFIGRGKRKKREDWAKKLLIYSADKRTETDFKRSFFNEFMFTGYNRSIVGQIYSTWTKRRRSDLLCLIWHFFFLMQYLVYRFPSFFFLTDTPPNKVRWTVHLLGIKILLGFYYIEKLTASKYFCLSNFLGLFDVFQLPMSICSTL